MLIIKRNEEINRNILLGCKNENNSPLISESVTEATVAKWLKKEGELVEKDDVLVELETDKQP